MSSGIELILDRALSYSLWCFLIAFVLLLLFASARLRARKRRIGDIYAEARTSDPEFSKALAERNPAFNEWRISLQTFLIALVCAICFFVLFILLPLPVFQNFATDTTWQVTPLRVTALTYDRFYEGFSVTGEVWNQTEKELPHLKVRVIVWGNDNRPLGEVVTEIIPDPLPPGTAGEFSAEYEENSPFIKGYKIQFFDDTNQIIPHVSGFNVTD